jgi:hypothetical protein
MQRKMHSMVELPADSMQTTHALHTKIIFSLSENVGDDVQSVDLDEFFECPSPNEPLVGS